MGGDFCMCTLTYFAHPTIVEEIIDNKILSVAHSNESGYRAYSTTWN